MRRLLIVVAAIPLLLLGLLAGLAGTQSGTAWVLKKAAASTPGDLRLEHQQGTLLTGLRLRNISWRQQGRQVELAQLDFRLHRLALLRGTLAVTELRARQLRLRLPKSEGPEESPPAPFSLPEFTLPFSLGLYNARVQDIRLQINGESLALDVLELDGGMTGSRVLVEHLLLEAKPHRLELAGEMSLGSPGTVSLALKWRSPTPALVSPWLGDQPASGQATLKGPLDHLQVEHQFMAPRKLRSEGHVDLHARPLTASLTHHWDNLDVTLPTGHRLRLADGRLHTRGQPDDYRLVLDQMTLQGPGLPASRVSLQASGNLREVSVQHLRLDSTQGNLSTAGRLAWSPRLLWDLQLTGESLDPTLLHADLRGDLNLAARVRGELGEQGVLRGSLDLKRLTGTLRDEPVDVAGLIAMSDPENFSIERLALRSGDARAQLSGRVFRKDSWRWALDIDAGKLDPSRFYPAYPGNLQVRARTTGSLPGDKPPRIVVKGLTVDGTLRDRTVTGEGDVTLHGLDHIDMDLQAAMSEAQVILRGRWSQRPDLELHVHAPSLTPLSSQLSGSLDAEASLTGSLEQPLLQARVRASELRAGEFSLERFQLSMTPDRRKAGDMSLSLDIQGLQRNQTRLLDQGGVEGNGSLAEHRLSWELAHNDTRLQGTLTGGHENAGWRGSLSDLRLSGAFPGPWRQMQPAALELAMKQAELAPLCLREQQGDGSICTDGRWQANGDSKLQLAISGAPLSALQPLIPRQTRLLGQVSASVNMTHSNDLVSGHLNLEVTPGHITLPEMEQEDALSLEWQSLQAQARLESGRLHAETRLRLNDEDQLNAWLNADPGAAGSLDGELRIHMADLRWLELVSPRLRNPQGLLQGRLTLGGNRREPAFGGELSLDDAAVEVPEAGIRVSDIQLKADARPDTQALQIKGRAHSGKGTLTVDGELDTSRQWPWPLSLRVTGSDFLAVDRQQARITLSPDLNVVLEPLLLKVRGEVTVPQARLRPQQIPQQAAAVSPDARLEKAGSREPASLWRTDLEVELKLGNDIQFQGFGLDARFGGSVLMTDKPGNPPRLNGEVRLEEGRYRAYGQSLRIERGRLLFQGPPDNPGLDIVAVRPLPNRDLRVGLEVGGTLKHPRPRVFSEPPMEESRAMAWLLTGRPLSGSSDAEANAILQAVTLYGLRRGEPVTEQLSETLGVNVGVEATGPSDQAALTLGKQLSSRLYLQYSMGLFESLSRVMLRYSLTTHLSLETHSSSRSQGADLIYRREVD